MGTPPARCFRTCRRRDFRGGRRARRGRLTRGRGIVPRASQRDPRPVPPGPVVAPPAGKGVGRLMDLDQATELIRHTLVLALVVSAPMLVIGLGVGIIVSLLQAVTQIQEQTLTFIPKIAAMFAAAILLLPWIGQRLIEYTASMLLYGQLP